MEEGEGHWPLFSVAVVLVLCAAILGAEVPSAHKIRYLSEENRQMVAEAYATAMVFAGKPQCIAMFPDRNPKALLRATTYLDAQHIASWVASFPDPEPDDAHVAEEMAASVTSACAEGGPMGSSAVMLREGTAFVFICPFFGVRHDHKDWLAERARTLLHEALHSGGVGEADLDESEAIYQRLLTNCK